MKISHNQALQSFARKLAFVLVLRTSVQFATGWFFVWGVVVLAARICGNQQMEWLTLGTLGFLPLIWVAALRTRRHFPAFASIRAGYDRWNACGGLVMSTEAADMDGWLVQLPEAVVPKFRWHGNRILILLAVSALFLATALLLPDRLTRRASRPLEIGRIVEQLQAEVQALREEKIIEDPKAEALQKQLDQLQKESTGDNPSKTWEALDHIKGANSEAAKQAAEEAVAKTTTLAQAETLAQAMSQAADSGLSEATASQSAQALASLVQSARLEDGLLNGEIPKELLSNLNGLSKQDLANLMKALEANKNGLKGTVGKLANLRLIDPALLAKCRSAGQCTNCNALAEYLSTCTNGCNLSATCLLLGKGGPGGGGPAAPMTWSDGTSEANTDFKEHVLPPSAHLSDAQLVGVSQAAPELSGAEVVAAPGALNQAAASGGAAHTQVLLPEHRQAVQNFFRRDDK